ncbi:helix-turn-helix domain-containing protein [Streptomyces sp. 205]|uniref:Helix-turn-helix domain-containing protein n=2 Tax=Streptomyces coffeae TaxID=621382 RepID=A0ABS1NCX9_9ACTN|nr:helix-turn-helix domain-containing protein [Streptomyces coffeae]
MLARGLCVLRSFRPGEPELPFSEIARRAEMPKATAHRIIAELVKEGMLERGERGLRLGMGLFMLGARVPRQLMLRNIAVPYAKQLHRITRGSAFVFIADPTGPDAVLVDTVRRTHGPDHGPGHGLAMEEMRASDRAATRIFHAFGAEDDTVVRGRAVHRDAETARARHQGFAAVRGASGAVGVAAPVLTAAGAAAGALAVAGPRARLEVAMAAAHLKTACAAVSRAMQRDPELVTAS